MAPTSLAGVGSADQVSVEVYARGHGSAEHWGPCGPCTSLSALDTSSKLLLGPSPEDQRSAPEGASSDNDTAAEEIEGPPAKFRKLPCAEPPPFRNDVRGKVADVLQALQAAYVPAGEAAADDFVQTVIAGKAVDDLFYVYDLSLLERLYTAWLSAMPRVHPYYAVKCNPNDGMIAMLAALGAGFDCASEAEITQVLGHGVAPERIIYAHPCKPVGHLRKAAAMGVGLTTFDTESELQKLAAHQPHASLLLRIRADDPSARHQLGNKYGADSEDVPLLLRSARVLGLHVCGVSFHVGSGAKSPSAFWNAIAAARSVFDEAKALGFNMCILDIGGGFCGGKLGPGGSVDFGGVPSAINAALAAFFPADGQLQVIAEPGRYFAANVASLLCSVNGWRSRRAGAGMPASMEYFISDGVYGSMNCLLYDHADLTPRALRSPLLPAVQPADDQLRNSTLFGPTCDGMDIVCRTTPLPRLRNGDWVLFPRFGAYTVAGACNFNGFPVKNARPFYVYTCSGA